MIRLFIILNILNSALFTSKSAIQQLDVHRLCKNTTTSRLKHESEKHSILKRNSAVNTFENPCEFRGVCNINAEAKYPVCYCDKLCTVFNDCCFDANRTDVSTQLDIVQEQLGYMTCELVRPKELYTGIYTISKCPPSSPYGLLHGELSKRCSIVNNTHLVSSKDGIVYRNMYCAMCHNVTDYNLWVFQFAYGGHCSFEKMISLNYTIPEKIHHVKNSNCLYWFVPPSTVGQLRSCVKYEISEMMQQKDHLCSEFQNPILIHEHSLYRNIYCHGDITNSTTYTCIKAISMGQEVKAFSKLDMTGMFNVNPANEISGYKKCRNKNDKYDKTKVNKNSYISEPIQKSPKQKLLFFHLGDFFSFPW